MANESEAPPNYEEALMTSSRYGSLPLTMNVHGQWTKWKSLNLCGATAKDRLCLIEMQTGYSGKAPLGMRTGFLLRNGMSNKDPLLAAAGDESQGLHAFNPDGIVFLPPLDPDPKSDRMDTELMRAEPGANNDIAFHFSIEVGEKQRREEFAWRKVKKGEDQVKRNGFKLVRLSSSGQTSQPSGSNVQNSSSSSSPVAGKDGETVAFLGWVMAFPSMTHAFTLELVDGQSDALGDRWTLMVIVTAIRLYTLHVKGKTSKFVVDIGKKNLGK
ncbi:hypothetical protein N7491_009434 [Penicillium cf. griseofulvum]|uniref:Uncharacterized protein n=1 Tax=Penicillium cf. griseofulvum TaxID=2972120 RepID=A0A9W9JMW3_9EURO|nr:hypothetical protein N7472_004973 [Penicillium cf. griseofulvum]KAJ5424218.1 hypothetical protein N7491_009434 [Penicillium cf. griseofulvum]KAJ5442542.1 hypothetical protein N7445_005549 [Penicillium cf. griseofulvum]